MSREEKEHKKEYFYRGLTAFLTVAACVLFFFFIFRFDAVMKYAAKLMAVIQPVIIGVIVAFLVNPLVNILTGWQRRIFSKVKHQRLAWKIIGVSSVLISLLAFLLVLTLIFYMIIPQLTIGIKNMVTVLPGQLDALINRIDTAIKANEKIEQALVSVIDYEKNWFQNEFSGYVNELAGYFASGVWNIVTFLKDFAIGLIFALYMLLKKSLLARQARKLLYAITNRETAGHIAETVRRIHSVFSGFIYGKLLDSLIIGILCFIGVTVLKIPYPMLVAVTVGVTNVIPVFGPYIGAVPCAALILLASPVKGLYFIILIIILQAFDGNFLGPKILGDSTGLPALWVVFAIVVGGGVFGIPGMLIGVPVFAVIYSLTAGYLNRCLTKKSLPLESDYYDSGVALKLCTGATAENTADNGQEEC